MIRHGVDWYKMKQVYSKEKIEILQLPILDMDLNDMVLKL